MTVTDLSAVQYASSLGVRRITLARELSLKEIERLVQGTNIELEVFAHGALCISYSGQCLTSEAIGGRSANRGACAQACRLPYDFVVDGERVDLGEQTYLLSPKDLDTSEHVAQLLATGIRAIKIEGRLKGPEYVAATTRLYRNAIDVALGHIKDPNPIFREASMQAFSRGSSLGFLEGTNHQTLVDGKTCDHVGVPVGVCSGVGYRAGKTWLRLNSTAGLRRGDGILVHEGLKEDAEFGGRIWGILVGGRDVEQVGPEPDVWLWLGPDKVISERLIRRPVYRTSSPAVLTTLESQLRLAEHQVEVTAVLRGKIGGVPELLFETSDGRNASVLLDGTVERAQNRPLDAAIAFEKLGRLGDTTYVLTHLSFEIEEGGTLALSALNRARRDAVLKLTMAAQRSHVVVASETLESQLVWPERPVPEPGIFVTCRTVEQAESALAAGATGIYLDFLGLTGAGTALRALRERFAGCGVLGIALPRIRKLDEEKIDRYVAGLKPDALLIRSLGTLFDRLDAPGFAQPTIVADFSFNSVNTLTALELIRTGAHAFTPSYDLDAAQLRAYLDSPIAPFAEVVIHHPMPLFHMEHCVIAAHLSTGKDFRDCGRPCESHVVQLRDRTGVLLPVEADVGCRNTVFHGKAQSAAEHVAALKTVGVRRFRIELLRESGQVTAELVKGYREVIEGVCPPVQLHRRLSELGQTVVRGSLRVVG
jgi:putative protease